MVKLKNKYKDIVGKRMRKTDFAQWSEFMFMRWFALVHFFIIEGKLSVTDISIKAFQARVENEPFWEEWMWRFNIAGDDFIPRTFVNQLTGVNGTMGAFLQENPHVITPKMKSVMEANPYLKKYTEPFAIKVLESGAEIVTTNMEGGKYPLPEIQYHKAILKMSAMANDLMSGITKDDIKKMPPGDRIRLANILVLTMSRLQGGHRPNIQIFKQLVINDASAENLESALVEMSKLN